MTMYSQVQVEPRQVGGPHSEVVPTSIQMTTSLARDLAVKLLAEAEKIVILLSFGRGMRIPRLTRTCLDFFWAIRLLTLMCFVEGTSLPFLSNT
jgi:hypothetical protein